MGRIKRLNENFAEDVSDAGFNSSNGVFKVSYIPYKDLSKPVGRDIFKNVTPQSQFQIGDVVCAKNLRNKEIEGAIVRIQKRSDNKGLNFFVKDSKTNKVQKINPYTIVMIQDIGNRVTRATINTSVTKANTERARYLNNPVALGSFESKTSQYEGTINEVVSSIDPDYMVEFGEGDSENTVYLDVSLKSKPIDAKRKEAEIVARKKLAQTELVSKEIFEALCDLWAITRLKDLYAEASYKRIISDFPSKYGISYGEFKDEYFDLVEPYL